LAHQFSLAASRRAIRQDDDNRPKPEDKDAH